MKRLSFLCAALFLAASTQGQHLKQFRQAEVASPSECTTGSAEADLHANNVFARLYNTGGLFWRGRGNFYEVPAYGGVHSIFAEGVWLGGMVGDELRFAGTNYGPHEFYPGPLDDNGNPPADCSPYDRIYLVSQTDLEAFEAGLPHTSDIEEWPWDLGAPVVDGDGDPDNYDLEEGDRPDVIGHQTAWWVVNDAAGPHVTSQSPALRMEMQVTAFALSAPDARDHTTFYRYKLIYKGLQPLTDAWFGLWVDGDLGSASDDMLGSDPNLDMGYFYNGDELDEGPFGYGSAPPALGYVILEGPVGDVDGEDNDDDGLVDEAGERLGMSKFLNYQGSSGRTGEPRDGKDMYGYLRGIWKDGTPITFGGHGHGSIVPTDHMYPGDPVTHSYWSEMNTDGRGSRNQPADRRFVMSTGPFSMNPGDVQEVLVAIVWSRGRDHLNSVARLREDVSFIRNAYDSGVLEDSPVPERLPAPEIEITPSEIALRLGPGEKNTRTLTIANTGAADLEWRFNGPPFGIARFLVTANAAGPLDPPDHGAFSFNSNGFPTPDGEAAHCEQDAQVVDYSICNDRPSHAQQVGPSRFGINVGGGEGTYDSYLSRSISERGRTPESLENADYEWRFTGSSLALRAFEDEAAVEVPFELWNTGMGTPADPSDDVRLVPYICETGCGGGIEPMVFDFGGDHTLSGGGDDPLSDWVYWYEPADMSPGQSGYLAFEDALRSGDTQAAYTHVGGEILARQVLVSWNAGMAPPYPQPLPEPGTIFRIETQKNWLTNASESEGKIPPGSSATLTLAFGSYLPPPGVYQDTVIVTSRDPNHPEVIVPVTLEVVAEPTAAEGDELPSEYTLRQNYPNPFNPSTTIRYGIPVAGPVRIGVYDVLGRRIRVLEEGVREAGWHTIDFDAGSLPSGLYFYRLETGGVRDVKSMLLAR